jgi:glycopeptide antibiotics resistance protein
VVYLAAVVALTILPLRFSGFQNPKEPGINLIPFIHTYKDYIESLSSPDLARKDFALENIFGNLIIFIPLGIFIPAIFKRCRSIKMVSLVCFSCSLSIELIQLLLRVWGTYRTADVDDIILNTSGGAIGYFLFWVVNDRLKNYVHPGSANNGFN